MNKILMLLRAVTPVFTEYQKMRAYMFDENFHRGPDKDIESDWTEFEENNKEVRTREEGISKLKDKDAGVASRAISTLRLDGILPQYERRRNLKRKQHNENRYDGYKKGEIYGR